MAKQQFRKITEKIFLKGKIKDPVDLKAVIYELIIHQVEIEQKNEEIKKYANSSSRKWNKYHLIYDDEDVHNSDQCPEELILKLIKLLSIQQKRFHFDIKSTPGEIKKFKDKLKSLFPANEKGQLAITSIYELIVNAGEHGNNFSENKTITIDLKLSDCFVLAIIEDEGPGFDVKQKFKNLSLNSPGERGRGIFMAQKCADYLLYNERGNRAYLFHCFKE